LDLDCFSVEFFAVKPSDGAVGSLRIVVGDSGFAFLFARVAVFVNPNLWFASSFIVFDDTD